MIDEKKLQRMYDLASIKIAVIMKKLQERQSEQVGNSQRTQHGK